MFGSYLTLRTAMHTDKLAGQAVVIQMCSILGIEPRAEPRAYSLTKQVVHEYIKAVRSDSPTDRMKVKAVYAGPIDTEVGMARFENEEAYHAEMKRLYGGSTDAHTLATQIVRLIESQEDDLVWDADRGVHVLRSSSQGAPGPA
jgi:short-subunit dehydrogenase